MIGFRTSRKVSHYRLLEEVGSGGMGTVYRAQDTRTRQIVAVKLLRTEFTDDPVFRERCEREALIASSLESPYVVRILDHGSADGRYFIVMEFVEGGSLGDLLEAAGALGPRLALRIAKQVTLALVEADERGIVHRDIKPRNVLLAQGDVVKVSDFGVARQETDDTLTLTGGFVGTLAYAAPEHLLGRAERRSDIYSLGATLYHMLHGAAPVPGTIAALQAPVLRDDDPDSEAQAGLPAEQIASVALRCMKENPGDRYQTGEELLRALDDAERSLPESALTIEVSSTHRAIAFGLLRRKSTELTLRNHGNAPVEARLGSRPGDIRRPVALPRSVVVGPGGLAKIRIKPQPLTPGWRAKSDRSCFIVSAETEPQSLPVEATGRLFRKSYGVRVPAGIAAVIVAGMISVSLAGAGRGDPDASVTELPTSTAKPNRNQSARATPEPNGGDSPGPTDSPGPSRSGAPSRTPTPSVSQPIQSPNVNAGAGVSAISTPPVTPDPTAILPRIRSGAWSYEFWEYGWEPDACPGPGDVETGNTFVGFREQPAGDGFIEPGETFDFWFRDQYPARAFNVVMRWPDLDFQMTVGSNVVEVWNWHFTDDEKIANNTWTREYLDLGCTRYYSGTTIFVD
jgi:serine/threonine protein kinase